MKRFTWTCAVLLLAGVPALADDKASAVTPQQTKFFEDKIRPLLVENCYKCHSVEKQKVKGNLALDSREGWQKGGDGGPAIVPGNTEASLLLKAVSYKDPELQMPKDGRLSDAAIADLTAWVKMGAPDPRSTGAAGIKLTGLNDEAKSHWAYQPITDPPVPTVSKTQQWVRSPVDNYMFAAMEKVGIMPSRPAPKAVLLRRASYDLIGLPPTPEELKGFMKDESPGAFEKVVDRLLASPHYGERWGRFWLDTARYADTNGDEREAQNEDYRYKYAWTYRDWVINAFNSDLPYDQFLLDQLAADQLPGIDKDPTPLAALGFLTIGRRFRDMNDTLDERIDTISKATMALTVSCARCHDHKFDPIPTTDYYSLHGILSSTIEPKELPSIQAVTNSTAVNDYNDKRAKIERKNRDRYYEVVKANSAKFREKPAAYLMAWVHGKRGKPDDLEAKRKIITDSKLDTRFLETINPLRQQSESVFLPLKYFMSLAADDFEGSPARTMWEKVVKDGDKKHPINPLVLKAFKEVNPESIKDISDVIAVYDKLFKKMAAQGEAYIKASESATSGPVTGFDKDLLAVIEFPIPVEPMSALTHDPERVRAVARNIGLAANNPYGTFYYGALNELELTHPGAPRRAMVVADAPKAKDSYVYKYGDPNKKGPIATRQFLQILAGKDRKPFTTGSGRLEFATCVISKDNPLTARVLVNRVWAHHFGEGIVRTLDDMGIQSCEREEKTNRPLPPLHQDVLDHLATKFMKEGWSIKKLHKEIMLSYTYQQSSEARIETQKKALALDPGNKYLWRANVRRLDFDAIRDSLLMFSGKLDRTVGGQSVNLTDEPYSNRRTVYGYIDRNKVAELLQQFDFADPNRPNSGRTSTIVPQQALFFMNSAMSADVAEHVVRRPEFLAAKTNMERLYALYEVIYQRAPRGEEMGVVDAFLKAHSPKKAADLEKAARDADAKARVDEVNAQVNKSSHARDAEDMNVQAGGDHKVIMNEGQRVERRKLTLWEQLAQALLFSNEVVYVN